VEINCPSCGVENWLENEIRCHSCNAVLRRCVDCTNYDRSSVCRSLNVEIDRSEAAHPSLLSSSTTCRDYRPRAPTSQIAASG